LHFSIWYTVNVEIDQMLLMNFNPLHSKVSLLIPTVWSKLIFQKISNLRELQQQPLHGRSLGKTSKKHS